MKSPQILIIEDEPLAAVRLQGMILEILPQARILATIDSVEEAAIWLGQNRPDLIMMDVQLADGLCFNLFNRVDVQAPVIFTTAYDAYALKAFRVQALDYLLKPLKRNELKEALDRYQRMLPPLPNLTQIREIYSGEQDPKYRDRYLVRLGTSIRVVDIRDIALIYTESKNTFLMTREGRRFPLDYSLEAIESQLDPALFFRANRQYILSLSSIGEMHVHTKSRIRVTTNPASPTPIIVSTEKSAEFKRWLAGKTG